MLKMILGTSWTKIGTIVSLLVAVLSLPQLGSIVPAEWMPTIVIALNFLMGLKKWVLPSEQFKISS